MHFKTPIPFGVCAAPSYLIQLAEILRNLLPAMEPVYSSVLLDDFVLPTRDTQLRGASEDIFMMVTLNMLERTSRQYEEKLCAAGLRVVNWFGVSANEEMIMEVKIARL